MARKAAAAHSQDTTSLVAPVRTPNSRRMLWPIISTQMASTQRAARPPAARYRPSRSFLMTLFSFTCCSRFCLNVGIVRYA